MMNLKELVNLVLCDYALDWTGPHGIAHWARVLENARRLAGATGADPAVVELFAILHDARRASDGGDPDHGPRAAEWMRDLHGTWILLDDDQFARLHRAVRDHTHEVTHPDPTIQTCWDADRLDLGRVGITPDLAYLGTEEARRAEVVTWADGRAKMQVIPDLVFGEWQIHLPAGPSGHRRVGYRARGDGSG